MYIEYSELLPSALQKLYNEGVKEESFNKNRALYAIKEAYREFVRDTLVIKRVVSLRSQANVFEYSLFSVDDHIIKKIYNVYHNDTCYIYGSNCACGCCSGTFSYQDGFITMCPPPECDGDDIDVCVALFPSSKDCLMDERVYELYGNYIASGAAAKLLPMSKARHYKNEYNVGASIAKSESADGWSKKVSRKRKNKWVAR